MKAGFLFAGIGGFELGAEAAGLELVWSNEIDPYCCNVLRKNFSHEIIEKSILDIVDNGCKELRPVDIICGGFPCQPFSHAGKRKGTGDDRYLWPAMLECIRRLKPKYVIGENVAGIITMDGGKVFKEVLDSLEVSGYEVESFIVPAISVGAPHRRDRVWIIAYASGSGTGIQDRQQEASGQGREASDEIGSKMVRPGNRKGDAEGVKSCGGNIAKVEGFDSAYSTGERLEGATGSGVQERVTRSSKQDRTFTADSNSERLERYREHGERSRQWASGKENWQEHWAEVAARICRVDDGLSKGVDGVGGVPKKASGRKHRLKALGNAVVPQVAYEIIKAVITHDRNQSRTR